MANKDVKYGAILSYVLIVINALYGVLITPFTIKNLGVAEYGVYKTISSFTAAFVVLDLGLGTTMMRYIAKFRAEKNEKRIGNYIAMCFIQAGVLIVISAIAVIAGYVMLDSIYADGLTYNELVRAKELYVVFGLWICIHIGGNVMTGIINGHNKFAFSNSIKLGSIIVRSILIIVLLPFVKNSLVLPWINVVLSIITILIEWIYAKFKLKVVVKYVKWEKSLFMESFKYTLLMFITSIVAQFNNSLDNVIIGAVLSSTAVTIYSIGLLIFSVYEQLSTSLSGVMLPTVINTLEKDDAKYTNTKELVIKVGRIQFALLSAVFIGFAILGKEFLNVWMGEGFDDAYIITLILMFPAMFELCINVCLSILRAKNIIGFRTVVLAVSTVVNFLVTLIGTKIYGYYAAAIGTGISFFVGSIVVMGIYYYKKLGINIIHIYKNIFKRIWVCLVASGVACIIAKLVFDAPMMKVIAGIVAFGIVYMITMLTYGLDDNEKKLMKINKFIKGAKENG